MFLSLFFCTSNVRTQSSLVTLLYKIVTITNMEPVHWLKITLDIAATGLLVLLYQYLALFAQPYHTSFYCTDVSINMPFKASTVTNLHLYIICMAIPGIFFALTEATRALYIRRLHSSRAKPHLMHSNSSSSSASSTSSSNSNANSKSQQRKPELGNANRLIQICQFH